MRDSLRLYGRYIGISVRGQMQYRASFMMMSLGNLLATGMEFLGIWALFARFGSLRGWTLPEVALFYGIVNLAFSCAEAAARGFDVFPAMIKSGDFDRLLLRPRGTAFQVAAQELQLMRVGRLLQGLAVLGWAVTALPVAWTAAKAALVMLAVLGGACLFIGLFVVQATLAFWTIESLEIMNTVTYGGTETGQLPMTIYRPWFRRFFTFVIPLACMNYIPMSAVLPNRALAGVPAFLPWLAPAAGVVFLLVSLRLWNVGVRHYVSTGS
jgi:ABC-2 type transport system permease protein